MEAPLTPSLSPSEGAGGPEKGDPVAGDGEADKHFENGAYGTERNQSKSGRKIGRRTEKLIGTPRALVADKMWLGFPFLNLLDVFVVGNVLDGSNEFDAVSFADDLPAQGGREGKQVGGGDRGEVALFQFGFDRGQFFREDRGAMLARAEEAVLEVIEFEGDLILELEAELAAPLDEGAAGDAEFGGDADKAPTLRAAFHEFLPDFGCVHTRF